MSVSSGLKEGIRQKLEMVQRRVALRVCGGYGTFLSPFFQGSGYSNPQTSCSIALPKIVPGPISGGEVKIAKGMA